MPPLFASAARRALLALLAFACLGAGSTASADERFIPQDMRACTAEHAASGYAVPCKQALGAIEAARELDKLKTADFVHAVDGDSLTVTLRMLPADLSYPKGPYLCCDLQAYLDKIGDNVYSVRFRWDRMASAMLDLALLEGKRTPGARIQHRGSPGLVLAGDKVDDGLIARAGAELTTMTYDAGPALGARKVSVFKGAACRRRLDACSVIYMPDGQSTSAFATRALANRVDMSRFVVVGVHMAKVDPNSTRMEELLHGINPARYDAYMRFMTQDLKRQIEGSGKPLRRIAAGYSNGGAWAYDALVTQRSHFDSAIIMSPGQWKTWDEASLPGRVAIVGAGFMEREFYRGATEIAAGLKTRGASVTEVYIPSGHSMSTWFNVWNAAITEFNRAAK